MVAEMYFSSFYFIIIAINALVSYVTKLSNKLLSAVVLLIRPELSVFIFRREGSELDSTAVYTVICSTTKARTLNTEGLEGRTTS